MIEQRNWRRYVYGSAVDQRLAFIGCPIPYAEALASASTPGVLALWARRSLHARIMRRSAQAELVSAGRSLEDVARITGVHGPADVLFELSRLEAEELEAFESSFYVGPAGLEQRRQHDD